MKLGMLLGYSGRELSLPMDLIKLGEELGFDTAWSQ